MRLHADEIQEIVDKLGEVFKPHLKIQEQDISRCFQSYMDMKTRVDRMEAARLPKIEVTEIKIEGKTFRLVP